MKIKTIGAVAGTALIGVFMLLFINAFQTSKMNEAVKTLENQGINVTHINYALIGCSQDDTFKFKWEGYNTLTKTDVKGKACSGILKGTTIRFN